MEKYEAEAVYKLLLTSMVIGGKSNKIKARIVLDKFLKRTKHHNDEWAEEQEDKAIKLAITFRTGETIAKILLKDLTNLSIIKKCKVFSIIKEVIYADDAYKFLNNLKEEKENFLKVIKANLISMITKENVRDIIKLAIILIEIGKDNRDKKIDILKEKFINNFANEFVLTSINEEELHNIWQEVTNTRNSMSNKEIVKDICNRLSKLPIEHKNNIEVILVLIINQEKTELEKNHNLLNFVRSQFN